MAIYSFWIFDRHCNCIFDREWTLKAKQSSGVVNSKQNEDTAKLLFGMIFSLKSICRKLGNEDVSNEIRTIATGKYRVHVLTTASGLWLVLLTDVQQKNVSEVLHHLYGEIYVPSVAENWLSPIDFAEKEEEKMGQGFRKIQNRYFLRAVEQYLSPMVSR
ncbi:LAMI_0G09340g1_1 [Lachancea mirantina]|uniref:Trafficking protein particle complex subunit n=1 Tax=Lachancea mirantina TaxID=1230905 RepID=A0A1G4KAB4_9SACH|nr:LAMI_0G09340g1_1 [Lachancea mirantina]